MLTRLFCVYLLAEITALAVLVSTIGFGRTVLVLLATFAVGIVLAGSQIRRQLTRLRLPERNAVTDGAFTALGTVLVVVPGLVSTVAGVLLLLPFSRAALRPVLAAAAMGSLGRRLPLVTVATAGARRYAARGRDDFIDGEVIDVVECEPHPLPVD